MPQDPWEVASEARPLPKVYFGQVFTDLFFCVLVKGQGKVPFDPSQHKVEDRCTSIKMDLQPLASSGLKFAISRDMIAESRVWAGIVLPSIKALGIEPKEVNETWVKVTLVETGETYTKRDTGETVRKTTLKFLEVYPDEAACEAAARAFFGGGAVGAAKSEELPPFPEEGEESGDTGGDQERETASKFLKPLYEQAGGDPGEFIKLIAGNPLTSKHFDLNSPEVTELFAGSR